MLAVLDRAGIPSKLALGYLGVIVFLVGDGLEVAWLQDYLVNHGLTGSQAAWMFAAYGICVTVAAWLSGVLTEALGPLVTMLSGAVLFLIGTLFFIPELASNASYTALFVTYAVRGFAYPLFSYSFLVVIAQTVEKERLGKAVGWFWFCWAGGFAFLGPWYSDFGFSVLHLTAIELLWTGPVFVVVGTLIALVTILQVKREKLKTGAYRFDPKIMLKGLTLPFENYRIGLGAISRVINTMAVFGFIAFMPSYMMELGFTRSEWLEIWALHAFSNIVFNVIFGWVGDRAGWRQTIIWGGGFLCMIAVLGFYYLPTWTGSFWIAMAMSFLLGVALAGYVPLSALMPSLEPNHTGAAVAVLNLSAGLATFVGPAIVGLLIEPVGIDGIIWVFAGAYVVSMVLVWFMKSEHGDVRSKKHEEATLTSH